MKDVVLTRLQKIIEEAATAPTEQWPFTARQVKILLAELDRLNIELKTKNKILEVFKELIK